jgi:hypothetical protein
MQDAYMKAFRKRKLECYPLLDSDSEFLYVIVAVCNYIEYPLFDFSCPFPFLNPLGATLV